MNRLTKFLAASVFALVPTLAFADTKIGLDLLYDRAYEATVSVADTLPSGLTFVGAIASLRDEHGVIVKTDFDGRIGQQLSVAGFDVAGYAGVGEDTNKTSNFNYYSAIVSVDRKLTDNLTLNLFKVRYRNAFDTANHFQSERVYTGLTWKFADSTAINASYIHTFDMANHINEDADGFIVGVSHVF